MIDLEFLQEEQAWMAQQVSIPKDFLEFQPHDIIFGIDIQYVGELAFCAVAVHHFNGHHIQTFLHKTDAGMEYLSGFFCFREGPPVSRTIRRILDTQNVIPKLIIIDGHGIAHPRGLGVASWLGVTTNIPSMGIAKRALLHYDGELQEQRGATLPIFHRNQEVGAVLRTQAKTQPVFVSPGYHISLKQSVQIALDFSSSYRIANPIRMADQAARVFAKGEKPKGGIVL